MAQRYDVTLKMLLRDPFARAVHAATGLSINRWLDAELPQVQNPRMDLLGEASDGSLLHLELQVRNDAGMPERMAGYALGIRKMFRKFARQIVLYAGDLDLRMSTSLIGPRFFFEYETIDLRNLDGEALLASRHVGDNILAIVTRLRDRKEAIEEIVRKISSLEETQRDTALRQLIVLAGLRGLEEAVEKEIRKMPTYHELVMDNKVLGREYKRGLLEGKREGELKGELRGELKGELKLLRLQIEKRFGPLPKWAQERLIEQSMTDMETLGLRLLDAGSLDELLR